MGAHLRTLENANLPRILLKHGAQTDDKHFILLSDDSGSDNDDIDLENVELTPAERAIVESVTGEPYVKRAKLTPGDCQTAGPPSFGAHTLQNFRNENETLATQAHVSNGRVTAPLRQQEMEMYPVKSPLYKSCVRILVEMIEGAYREKNPDLMEYLHEELKQVLKRQQELIKAGSDGGYFGPLSRNPVVAYRKSLHTVVDPAYQAEQANKGWGALTFEKVLENLRNPRREEAEPTTPFEFSLGDGTHIKYKKVAKRKKYPDPPEVEVYRRACIRATRNLIDGAEESQQPLLLLRLLEEDLQLVQARQQLLFRAEDFADSLLAPTQTQVPRPVTCNGSLSKEFPTGGGLSMGRESMHPVGYSVHNLVIGARGPFTVNQRAEFHLQALIFNNMVAGVVVPLSSEIFWSQFARTGWPATTPPIVSP